MKRSVNFRLEDLPPHLRSQAERQIAADNARRLKSPLRKPQEKHPIRIPKKREPNATELRYLECHEFLSCAEYEALTFKVASGKYTPDWVYFLPNGRIACVEVKGAYRFGSQSGASAKFKEAVNAYPNIRWVWAKWTGDKWEEASFGGEVGAPEAPVRPGESPHVRPCACARSGAPTIPDLEYLRKDLRGVVGIVDGMIARLEDCK